MLVDNMQPQVCTILRQASVLFGKGSGRVKCLDKKHKEDCKVCTEAPCETELDAYIFVGDSVHKSGEDKLRSLIVETPEWTNDEKKEAVMSAFPQDAAFCKALIKKDGRGLKKEHLVRLCNIWKLKSDIWQLKSKHKKQKVTKTGKRKAQEQSSSSSSRKSSRSNKRNKSEEVTQLDKNQLDVLTSEILSFLERKKDYSLTKFQSVIAQDPANLRGLNGYEDENIANISKYAKTNMPFVIEFLTSMMHTSEIAKQKIFTMLVELRETNPKVLMQPAGIGLQLTRQSFDFNSVNSIMTMFGYCCSAFRSAVRPKRPQHIELYIAEAANGCVEITDYSISKIEEVKNSCTLEVYFNISLTLLTFLQRFFNELRELAKTNYFIKFGEEFDPEDGHIYEEYKEQIWDFFW